MPDLRCAAILLAAGASTRLGRPKQLLRIDGESLLRRTARFATQAGCSPVFVVLGFEASEMVPELDSLGVETILNPAWPEGMGASLHVGMERLRCLEPQPQAVLLLVCDQPRLSAAHLGNLLLRHAAARPSDHVAITASVYAGHAGVPAVFSAPLFPQLRLASGDRGAKDLIRAQAERVQGIPWPEGEFDLDRPEDLSIIER